MTHKIKITGSSGNVFNVDSVGAKLAHTATYQVQFYSLDVILAVGYRINSNKVIAFCQWATKTLKDHIYKGCTINQNRIQKNHAEFLKTMNALKKGGQFVPPFNYFNDIEETNNE